MATKRNGNIEFPWRIQLKLIWQSKRCSSAKLQSGTEGHLSGIAPTAGPVNFGTIIGATEIFSYLQEKPIMVVRTEKAACKPVAQRTFTTNEQLLPSP